MAKQISKLVPISPSKLSLIGGYLDRMTVVGWTIFFIILSAASLIARYPFDSIFVAIGALFLPGYLLALIVLGKLSKIEAIVYGIVLSVGLIVVGMWILNLSFAFNLDYGNIVRAELLVLVILVVLMVLRRKFLE